MNTWKRMILAWLCLGCLGLAPVGAAFAQVKVMSATPSSAYQGTVALDVVVSGSGFDPSAKVQYFVSGTTNPGGITVRSVSFRSSKELVTTIDVAATATLASFDIQVMLDSGRKGKGTTLFAVRAKQSDAPTYPPSRFYHSFTSNGGSTTATSRLYMFGGAATYSSDLGDLWAYSNAGSTQARWTFIPGGSVTPSVRHLAGWACGGGQCVLVNGWRGSSWVGETWVFSEATQTWAQASCRKASSCPSYRAGPAMAYDQAHGVHVLFGGQGELGLLNDTLTFSPATLTWTRQTGGNAPSARSNAATVFVPGVGVVLSGGWGEPCCITTLNDMHVWDGAVWTPVASSLAGNPGGTVPSLANHDMAWDTTRHAMIVTGGFTDTMHTPNSETWQVTFSNASGAWQATWSLLTVGCQSTAGSPPDPVVHAGAHMAFDGATNVQVFFGGEANGGASSYGNTVECQ